jgi:hypothetical protein
VAGQEEAYVCIYSIRDRKGTIGRNIILILVNQ